MAVEPEQTIDAEHFSLEDLSAFVDLARGGAARRVEWTALVTQFQTMLCEFPHIIQTIHPENKLVRARTISLNEVVDDVTKLGPPPPEKCRDAGRCNWVARPTAYFGVGEDLSLSEINARIGDRVGFLYAQPSREMHLLRLGAIDLHRRTSGMCDLPEHIKRDINNLPRDRQGIKVHLFDAFISEFFARRGNKDVYKVTSAFTQALFDTMPELDGILYDSVNHVRGACIAIRQDSYAAMRPTEVRLVNVNADLGYGIYEYQEEAFSNTFDGISIKWEEAMGSG